MDYHRIKDIIDRFWRGETNLEEENLLKDYFRYNDNSPEEFEDTAEYFRYIEEESKIELGDDFDLEIMSKIKALETKKPFKIWPILLAACVTLLLGLVAYNMMDSSKPMNQAPILVEEEFEDTYDNPEEAYENVRAALMMMSSGLKEGASYTGELKKFSEAQKEISK